MVTDVCPGNVTVDVAAWQVPGNETVLVTVCAGAAGEQDPWTVVTEVWPGSVTVEAAGQDPWIVVVAPGPTIVDTIVDGVQVAWPPIGEHEETVTVD